MEGDRGKCLVPGIGTEADRVGRADELLVEYVRPARDLQLLFRNDELAGQSAQVYAAGIEEHIDYQEKVEVHVRCDPSPKNRSANSYWRRLDLILLGGYWLPSSALQKGFRR